MAEPNASLVAVITGASSGIGRATAHAFAERGAAVVLAARRADKLAEVEAECADFGGRALAVRTDVTQEADVEALARLAVETYGHIDVWFNNAGVGAFGAYDEIPIDVWRRLMDVNFFGYVFGARAALAQFRRQGHGLLVNNASIAGRIAHPEAAPYVASKYAVRGLSEALRQELLDYHDIQVCSVLPAAIDTPFFQHAANFSGRHVQAMPPVYAPEDVAQAVVGLIDDPQQEVIVGRFGKIAATQRRLAPSLTTRLTGRGMHRSMYTDEPAPETAGSLFQPSDDDMAVYGGWRRGNGGARKAMVSLAAGAAVLVPLGVLAWRMRSKRGGDRPEPRMIEARSGTRPQYAAEGQGTRPAEPRDATTPQPQHAPSPAPAAKAPESPQAPAVDPALDKLRSRPAGAEVVPPGAETV